MRDLFFGILLIGLLATPAPAVVTEQIVAIVNGQLLFQTDLLRDQIFFSQHHDVEKLVEHKLLLFEAKRFVLSPPQEDEIDLSFQEVQKQFSNKAAFSNALKETGLTIEGLKREILDRLWVKKLIRDRITFFIFITDEEIAQYYQGHQNDFEQKELKDSEKAIRAILEKEKEETKIKEYIARIRSQANIEINVR
ncbi:MAG: hypothetical protein HY201_02145 [Nitrospirae bacterium]|nr:hypothetical protein [Candidatus Troglogloeales bacterium]MBI3598244.1 hypothetical protein [Candidatus Troglogloeales bacterium]